MDEVSVYSKISKNGFLILEIEIPAENKIVNPKVLQNAKDVLKSFVEENKDNLFY